MRVLIAEDEKRLAQSIAQILYEHQIDSEIVHSGDDAFDYASMGDYDVILLDVMLPELNGFEIVKALRKRNINTPVLFLTAKDEIADKVYGLNQGGDDYMTKPFANLELVARIKALVRRKNEVFTDEITFGDLTLNLNTHILAANNRQIQLSVKEYTIFELLMNSPQQVFSKEQIITKVWGYDSEADENNVETYISFLRKKLDYLRSMVAIKTLRKVGYHLVENHND